ncbi:uncharacterized protein LOC125660289 [Ostrea edulis]|uniref:uncharacterized protein LOC125660289 n=1 Tax=Ostrea edulis TaxID=37623 RepID=UPI0024AEA194|nr:uncharacterized protein LOC125660289 [Ostrea edulis]
MEQDMMTMTCTVENAGDGCIADPINTLSPLEETDKNDVMQTPQTAYLITDTNGIVLLEQRGNMFLSVSNEMNNLNYTGISTSPELQGRQLLTTSATGPLLTSVQQEGMVDPQGMGVLLGVQTDVGERLDSTDISDTTNEQLLDNADDITVSPTSKQSDKPPEQKKRGGWPKGKRRKNVPNVNAPKAPLTGYVMYAIERRQEIKESNPELTFPEVTKILGNEWSTLDSEKKQKYLLAAQEDKKRYMEQLKTFQQSDAYMSAMKKKKGKGFPPGQEVEEAFPYTMDEEEGSMNELYCRVCDQYFSSLHNKKEHMFGRQHLQNITGEIQKDLQLQAEQESRDLAETSLVSSHLGNESSQSGDGICVSQLDILDRTSPVDVQGFINGFLQENLDREFEIKQIRRHFKLIQEENNFLIKQINELKLYQNKLEEEVAQYKTNNISINRQGHREALSIMASWRDREIKGVLLDITGALFESGSREPIEGSVEAIQRLKSAGLPVRFCTNETTMTRTMLTEKLHKLGFTMNEKEIFPPIPAVCKVLQKRNLRPHLLVHPKAAPDFDGVDTVNPNCVILGDATTEFSYHNLNKAFLTLMAMKEPVLFSLGLGRYYREDGELTLDVGPFTKALEFAADVKAEVVGKPSPTFFNSVLEDMDVGAENAVMVGDDIVSDVGGAQACGMLGIQVRTGKFRCQDENHPTVKPDAFADNLLAAVNLILQASK